MRVFHALWALADSGDKDAQQAMRDMDAIRTSTRYAAGVNYHAETDSFEVFVLPRRKECKST